MPGNYDSDVVAYVKKDYLGHPQLYQLPPPVRVEYWNHGSESRNNYAFGNEYSKGGFQVSAAMGIFDGKRERIEKPNQTYD
jgi:hypothetical protein